MNTTASGRGVRAADARTERAAVLNRRRLIDLLVTAEARDEDRAWLNLTPGMCSLLAWVEPLAILREIALHAHHSDSDSDSDSDSEKVCLCLVS